MVTPPRVSGCVNYTSCLAVWPSAPCPISPGLTWVSDAHHQQLAEHVSHHLHGRLADHVPVAADQVDGGREQARAGARRLHADLLVLAVQEVVSAVAHKLGQGMSCRERETRT